MKVSGDVAVSMVNISLAHKLFLTITHDSEMVRIHGCWG